MNTLTDSIQLIRERQQKLETEIMQSIQSFEKDTGASVGGIRILSRSITIGSDCSEVVRVGAEVKL